jgi:MYXO-CTERM domain-containing protein
MTTSTARTIQFILAGALAALPAAGTAITFSISQEAVSGTLGATPFTNALVTFSQTTDTTLISALAACGYPCAQSVTTNTITIQGVGTVTQTSGSYFFDNGINLFGITNESGSAFLAAEDGSFFDTYNMLTAFGPTTYSFWPGSTTGFGLATSGGTLAISWNSDQQATAQACLGANGCSTASTPEPSSLGMALLGGITLAAGLLRRRKR